MAYFAVSGMSVTIRCSMAKLILNSFLRDILAETGATLPAEAFLELPVTSVRNLLRAVEEKYPGSKQKLTGAAVAIDGDIHTDALAEALCDDSELVFIPAIEGG